MKNSLMLSGAMLFALVAFAGCKKDVDRKTNDFNFLALSSESNSQLIGSSDKKRNRQLNLETEFDSLFVLGDSLSDTGSLTSM